MSRIHEQQKTSEAHPFSPSWKERWSYTFDNYMAKGTPALIAGLAGITLVLIFITLGGIFVFSAEDEIIVLAES